MRFIVNFACTLMITVGLTPSLNGMAAAKKLYLRVKQKLASTPKKEESKAQNASEKIFQKDEAILPPQSLYYTDPTLLQFLPPELCRMVEAYSGWELYGPPLSNQYTQALSFMDNYLITAENHEAGHKFCVWNCTDGKCMRTFNTHNKHVLIDKAAFSPEGKYVVVKAIGSGDIHIFDCAKNQCLSTLTAGTSLVAVSSFAQHIAIHYTNYPNHPRTYVTAVLMRNNHERSTTLTFAKQHKDLISTIACSSDGNYLATSDVNGQAYVWDCKTGLPIHEMADVNKIIFSPRDTYLATASHHCAYIWDYKNSHLQSFFPRPFIRHKDYILAIAFNLDETILATGGNDCSVRMYDCKTGKCLQEINVAGAVRDIIFNQDSTLAVAHDRSVKELSPTSVIQCYAKLRLTQHKLPKK